MLNYIATLLPVVMVIVQFAKKRLNLDGWIVVGVSIIISAGGAVYVGITNDLNTIQIILVGLGTSASANGAYDLVKEIAGFIKE